MKADGITLLRAYVRLDSYRNSSLPASFLADLEKGLEDIRNNGFKVVLHFAYNFAKEPDAPKARIIEHIRQLAPVFRKYVDVIYVIQGGFIGAWGEWHSSTNGLANTADRRDILAELLAAIPDTRMVQIRKPSFKLNFQQDPKLAFSAADAARIAHYNACFLYDASDRGTYKDTGSGNTQEQLKEYTAQDTKAVSMGGTTCGMSGVSREKQGVAEMERMHWTYLNPDFWVQMTDYWKQTGEWATIERKLGYRFRVDSAEVPSAVKPGGHFTIRISLYNEGWAPLYNPRPVFLVLDGLERQQIRLGPIDPRQWAAGVASTFTAEIELPLNITPGDYKIAIWMPDYYKILQSNPAYSIRFANTNIWDSANGYNVLGTVNINNNAPGTQNTSADTIRVLSAQ